MKSYLVIWRDQTIPEASVFSIQMLDKYLGTWEKNIGWISLYKDTAVHGWEQFKSILKTQQSSIASVRQLRSSWNITTLPWQAKLLLIHQNSPLLIPFLMVLIFSLSNTICFSFSFKIREVSWTSYTSHRASFHVKTGTLWHSYTKCAKCALQSPPFFWRKELWALCALAFAKDAIIWVVTERFSSPWTVCHFSVLGLKKGINFRFFILK